MKPTSEIPTHERMRAVATGIILFALTLFFPFTQIRAEDRPIIQVNFEFEGDLFQRTDVTTPVEQMLGEVPDEIARQLDAIGGPLPEVAIGAQCFEPWECPRCHVIHAGWVDRCTCPPPTFTTTGGTGG